MPEWSYTLLCPLVSSITLDRYSLIEHTGTAKNHSITKFSHIKFVESSLRLRKANE